MLHFIDLLQIFVLTKHIDEADNDDLNLSFLFDCLFICNDNELIYMYALTIKVHPKKIQKLSLL